MKRFAVDESVCRNLEKALQLEWLDTNGLGGYASSTILGCNTRKYHGLLVGNLKDPKGRYALLAWLEDAVAAEKEIFLSCAQYPGFFFPGDEQPLSEFRLDNFPMFTYEAGGIRIRKSVMMVEREDRVLVRYEIEKLPRPGSLRIRPFLAFRGYHGLTRENTFIRKDAEELGRGWKVQPYDGMPPLVMETNVVAKF